MSCEKKNVGYIKVAQIAQVMPGANFLLVHIVMDDPRLDTIEKRNVYAAEMTREEWDKLFQICDPVK